MIDFQRVRDRRGEKRVVDSVRPDAYGTALKLWIHEASLGGDIGHTDQGINLIDRLQQGLKPLPEPVADEMVKAERAGRRSPGDALLREGVHIGISEAKSHIHQIVTKHCCRPVLLELLRKLHECVDELGRGLNASESVVEQAGFAELDPDASEGRRGAVESVQCHIVRFQVALGCCNPLVPGD